MGCHSEPQAKKLTWHKVNLASIQQKTHGAVKIPKLSKIHKVSIDYILGQTDKKER